MASKCDRCEATPGGLEVIEERIKGGERRQEKREGVVKSKKGVCMEENPGPFHGRSSLDK